MLHTEACCELEDGGWVCVEWCPFVSRAHPTEENLADYPVQIYEIRALHILVHSVGARSGITVTWDMEMRLKCRGWIDEAMRTYMYTADEGPFLRVTEEGCAVHAEHRHRLGDKIVR